MGALLNTVNNAQSFGANSFQLANQGPQLKNLSQSMSSNMTLAQCPVVSEFKNVGQGIQQGDFKKMALNAGVLGASVLAGSQGSMKGMQMGGKAQYAALGAASTALSGASETSSQTHTSQAGQTNTTNSGNGSMEMQESAGTNSLQQHPTDGSGSGSKRKLSGASDRPTKINFNQIFEKIDVGTRKTKIICTLGPACWDVEMLGKLLDCGMNIARFNFSHGDHATHSRTVSRLREALKQRPHLTCAIMLDTKGPEIRSGFYKDGGSIEITAGQKLKIVTDYDFKGDNTTIACSYKALPQTVQVGSVIYVADGSLTCEVAEIHDDHVIVTCKNGCKIGERKNMNLPGAIVDLPTLTPKDEKDLVDFGLTHDIDFIAASFVRKASDIAYIRKVLGPKGDKIHIISKIENQEGLQNYDEILEASDGIMVARGDLGMEIPPEKVFLAQKWMIEKANAVAKPVATATQMLESMINAPRPTRAEASDVANAVLDGSDMVMLSGESANGSYPTHAVGVMARTCVEAENSINYQQTYQETKAGTPHPDNAETVASAAAQAVLDDDNISMIVCMTGTGKLARLVAKYRPSVPILAVSDVIRVVRQMNCIRGVHGLQVAAMSGTAAVAHGLATQHKLYRAGSKVVVVSSTDEGTPDEANSFKIVTPGPKI